MRPQPGAASVQLLKTPALLMILLLKSKWKLQVTFIYIELFTIQIVSKHLHS